MANGNDSKDTKLLTSEEDADQHHGGVDEAIPQEDRFDDLVQTGRHLAHELNNLLTTILANTQLMLIMVEDEELKSCLSAVEDAASDAGTIVSEFQKSVRALSELTSQKNVQDVVQQPEDNINYSHGEKSVVEHIE